MDPVVADLLSDRWGAVHHHLQVTSAASASSDGAPSADDGAHAVAATSLITRPAAYEPEPDPCRDLLMALKDAVDELEHYSKSGSTTADKSLLIRTVEPKQLPWVGTPSKPKTEERRTSLVATEEGDWTSPMLLSANDSTTLAEVSEEPGSETRFISDEHHLLETFCSSLEACLRLGLKSTVMFSSVKYDYWDWITELVAPHTPLPNESSSPAADNISITLWPSSNSKPKEIPTINPIMNGIVSTISSRTPSLQTPQGRGRQFIRMALTSKVLTVPLQQLSRNKKLREAWYSKEDSILGHPKHIQELIATLYEITAIDFQLDLSNTTSLDDTWTLPIMRHVTFIKSPEFGLGIDILQSGEHITIVGVKPGSPAANSNAIDVGDILENVNGLVVANQPQSVVTQHIRAIVGRVDLVIRKSSSKHNEVKSL
ncbi:hypothetical protein CAOG_01359 [Capsaspora owczarzaki ATCC 30864]|uniref:PDZ domain-containing protein n=1 Tax=Capsaspora owczarzaki (strain ATCC 30864) TaxID=595528 RepID=A0A0D2U463_CAPO3|nr:hypothetical protein CAOG_01359 [Capsaspora owczarzaki ATCC 30864]KJE89966.1 hypothetical protein CAOG_001359 [Capsaspora owczarzaki ATCC 30864]|eukprot:XP_004349879.2 hypothetical protein CAOG_01359 [Capsaspora owczarzaki ATCC 30864]